MAALLSAGCAGAAASVLRVGALAWGELVRSV
jgi:hypothetical protein